MISGANGIWVGWRQKLDIINTEPSPLSTTPPCRESPDTAELECGGGGGFFSFHLIISLTPRLRACDGTGLGHQRSLEAGCYSLLSPPPVPPPPGCACDATCGSGILHERQEAAARVP